MATKTTAQKAAQKVQEPVKQEEVLKYVVTFPNGMTAEGTVPMREFKPNSEKGFQNRGFQAKIANGQYSGSIMIVDYDKQKRI